MIVATVTAILLIFGGGGPGHYLVNADKAIKKTLEDKTQRQEVLAITKQLGKDLGKQRKSYTKAVDGFLDLPQSHGTSPETFDEQIERLMVLQTGLVKTTLDAREDMRKRMTPQQWQAVFDQGQQ